MTYLADCPKFRSAEGFSRAGARPLGFESRHWSNGVTSFSCSGTSPCLPLA